MSQIEQLWRFLIAPWQTADWPAVRGFWLEQVFDDRFQVVYFLPLVPLLLLVPRKHFRMGLIAAGLVFVAYLYGAFYAVGWLLLAIGFYHLAERFAVECKRTDVLPIGPPIAAILLIGVWYLVASHLDSIVQLPTDVEVWLRARLPWLYPLGYRGLAWERWGIVPGQSPDHLPRLFDVFRFAHIVGTAYLAVRLTHYFAEIRRGGIPDAARSLPRFLAYVCYGPALMQGPIERFPEFQQQVDACFSQRSLRWTVLGVLRIGWGVFKGLVATFYFYPVILRYMATQTYYAQPELIESYALLYFGVFINIFWLYLEFSGYCDISAGIAWILGYRQIENFQWCWFATSLRDFWRRWHISLSSILRDYVYIPIGGNKRPLVALVSTFAICGIWHEVMVQMVLWGMVMGVMLWVNQQWVGWVRELDAQPSGGLASVRRAWLRLWPLPQLCAWLLTMHAFVFSLLIFFGGAKSWRVLYEIIRRPIAALAN